MQRKVYIIYLHDGSRERYYYSQRDSDKPCCFSSKKKAEKCLVKEENAQWIGDSLLFPTKEGVMLKARIVELNVE